MDLTFLDILLFNTDIFFNLGICYRQVRSTGSVPTGNDYKPASLLAIFDPIYPLIEIARHSRRPLPQNIDF